MREMYRLAIEENWGRRRIAQEFGFSDSQVRYILSNERYTGYMIVDDEIVKSELPVIIPLHIFCRLNHNHKLCREKFF